MHNQTLILLELFYDWQGYKNINENGTHTADTNDNILMIQIIVIHILKLSTKFVLT